MERGLERRGEEREARRGRVWRERSEEGACVGRERRGEGARLLFERSAGRAPEQERGGAQGAPEERPLAHIFQEEHRTRLRTQ